VQKLRDESIPAELQSLTEHYSEVTDDRDQLLWKWLWHVLPEFRLSCVPAELAGTARKAKFCFSVYMTLLDDVSERHRDRATFQAGRRIPFSDSVPGAGDPAVDSELFALLEHAWELTDRYMDAGPERASMAETFEFDFRQSLNTMDYNRLVNDDPALASPTGADLYDTHNMLLFPYVDIDLCFSPGFDSADLPTLRDVTWEAQRLVRIGNWVTTWERELAEDDYTSKVVVEALDRGIVTRDQLTDEAVPDAVIRRRIAESDIVREQLLEWNRTYGSLRSREFDVRSVDLDAFVDGIRYLLEVDVKARGYK
jgi:hypothetical protein